eukprot:5200133-Pleurochrysis_carterae.AAC.1
MRPCALLAQGKTHRWIDLRGISKGRHQLLRYPMFALHHAHAQIPANLQSRRHDELKGNYGCNRKCQRNAQGVTARGPRAYLQGGHIQSECRGQRFRSQPYKQQRSLQQRLKLLKLRHRAAQELFLTAVAETASVVLRVTSAAAAGPPT